MRSNPSSRAAVRYSLGRTFLTLGDIESAEHELLAASDLQGRLLGETHRDSLKTRIAMVLLLRITARLSEAEHLGEEVLEQAIAAYGEADPITALAMNQLSSVYVDLHRYEEAESLLRSAIRIREQHFGSDHEETLGSMSNLAILFGDTGRMPERLELQRQVLNSCRLRLGEKHPTSLKAMTNLGMSLYDMGDFDSAEPLLIRSYELTKEVHGPGSFDALGAANNAAGALLAGGKVQKAEVLFREILQAGRSSLGDGFSLEPMILMNLSGTLRDQGRLEEAERTIREAADLAEKRLGPRSLDAIMSRANLAAILHTQGKVTEAESISRQVLADAQETLHEEDWLPDAFAEFHGECLLDLGRYEEAETGPASQPPRTSGCARPTALLVCQIASSDHSPLRSLGDAREGRGVPSDAGHRGSSGTGRDRDARRKTATRPQVNRKTRDSRRRGGESSSNTVGYSCF